MKRLVVCVHLRHELTSLEVLKDVLQTFLPVCTLVMLCEGCQSKVLEGVTSQMPEVLIQ